MSLVAQMQKDTLFDFAHEKRCILVFALPKVRLDAHATVIFFAEAYQVKKKSRAASFAGNQGARSGDRQGSQQHMAGKKGAVVDWEGASGDKRLPWTDTSGSQQERRDGRPQVFVPSNLPEWAQRRLQEQQQQEEQSQRPVAESDRQKKQ